MKFVLPYSPQLVSYTLIPISHWMKIAIWVEAQGRGEVLECLVHQTKLSDSWEATVFQYMVRPGGDADEAHPGMHSQKMPQGPHAL